MRKFVSALACLAFILVGSASQAQQSRSQVEDECNNRLGSWFSEFGTSGNDSLGAWVSNGQFCSSGFAGADQLYFHSAAKSVLYGGSGNDDIRGGSFGKAFAYGEEGNDFISGYDSSPGPDDVLRGGDGSDDIYGRGGDDVIWDGPGADNIHGNAGTDTLCLAPDGVVESNIDGIEITKDASQC